MATAVVFPSACNRGRSCVWLFSAYAILAGTSLVVYPKFFLEFPLLGPIERLTGLAHMASPTTLDEQRYVSIFGIFATAIGLIYALQAGPYWNYGGKVFVQASIDGRLIFSVATVALCLFTEQGSSCLFMIGVCDFLFALGTQAVVGNRRRVYGIPQSGKIHLDESDDELLG